MTKNTQPIGRSKVRIFFVDADVAPGDIKEITNALASAIRPLGTAMPRLEKQDQRALIEESTTLEEPASEENGTEPEQQESLSSGGSPRPRKPRRSPNVVDLNMQASGVPFKAFAEQCGPLTEHVTRYLVATSWLKDYAKISPASVDQVFTCYKHLDWPYNMMDPTKPFRNLQQQRLGDLKDGMFTINHIGEDRVKEMRKVSM